MYGGGKEKKMLEDKCEGVRYNSTTNERNRNRMKGMVLENNTKKMIMRHAGLGYVHSSGDHFGTVGLRPHVPL